MYTYIFIHIHIIYTYLGRILKIKWNQYISNDEVQAQAGVEDVEILLVRSHIRWLEHVSRMQDDRPVKTLLYGEFATGTRPIGLPRLRYKDACTTGVKRGQVLDQ